MLQRLVLVLYTPPLGLACQEHTQWLLVLYISSLGASLLGGIYTAGFGIINLSSWFQPSGGVCTASSSMYSSWGEW